MFMQEPIQFLKQMLEILLNYINYINYMLTTRCMQEELLVSSTQHLETSAMTCKVDSNDYL